MTHPTTATQLTNASSNLTSQVLVAIVVSKENPSSFPCYWLLIDKSAASQTTSLKNALEEILVDPLLEDLWFGSLTDLPNWYTSWHQTGFTVLAEKQFFPGVTDNLAHIVEEALEMKELPFKIKVASGRLYLAKNKDIFAQAPYQLYHPLIEQFVIHDLDPKLTTDKFLTFPSVSLSEPSVPQTIDLSGSDAKLEAISRERLLALTLAEMQIIRDHFDKATTKSARQKTDLPTAPTDVELEILAQTWSEHCKHKIFNANISHTEYKEDGTIENINIQSLYKSFIQKVTKELSPKRPDLLSVFVDNSGVVKWNDKWAVCFKVETHNSPSALEPYGGALTGILGVNRDIIGTGLGAKPIFNTDILCFAYPSKDLPERPKLLPPQTILNGVRKGIQDGGNKSGIPTVNGAIIFDPDYRAKPLVFCGTGGLLPLKVAGLSGVDKHTKAGDTIVMAGGRVGKDGIHGATFSSEVLHEGSPVTAVQIGDPFTQKRLMDFVLEARDLGLITGITDNGAGGLSSSVGEMAQITGGATIELEKVPTKYPGLTDWEIVVSESQERMTISTNKLDELQKLALKHHVEVSAIGQFNKSGKFEVTRKSKLIASLDLDFLHGGLPPLELDAEWHAPSLTNKTGSIPKDLSKVLLKLLQHPNICNRESVVRQYDHEVQAQSVIKPLMGKKQKAACDAAVITPILGEAAGLVISNGIAPRLSKYNAKLMAICAVDEAIRNAVCVGADPFSFSLLDNFCWPDPVASTANQQGKKFLAQLVMSCQGLYEAALSYEAPLISGKDSMKNDFDDGVIRLSIPPTLLISAISRIPDHTQSISMEFKKPADLIYLLSAGKLGLAGSHYEEHMNWQSDLLCSIDLANAKNLYQALHAAILNGWVNSAHDLSEGGLAVALSECIIGGELGAIIKLKAEPRLDLSLFGEGPANILVTIDPANQANFETLFEPVFCSYLGEVIDKSDLLIYSESDQKTPILQTSFKELKQAWDIELPFS